MNVCKMTSALLIGFFFFIPQVSLASTAHGVLRVVKGDVQIKSGKDGSTAKGRLGSKVFPKDIVITGKDSRAKIVMIDNNEINISPDSHVELQNYEYDPARNKKDVLLNVIYGKVRSKVEQKYDGKTSKFQIKTPSAVAGVRGTDFLTGYNPSTRATQVVTFQGEVAFGLPGPQGQILNPVNVTPGRTAEVSASGAAPSAPVAMPKEELAKVDGDSKADSASASTSAPSSEPRTPAQEKDQDTESTSDDSAGDSAAAEPKPASESKSDDKKEASTSNSGGDGGTSAKGPKSPSAAATDSGAKNSATPSASERAPASTPSLGTSAPAALPPLPGGGMMRPEDFAGAPNAVPVLPVGPTPSVPAMVPQLPKAPTTPAQCDFCNRVIEDGSSKVIIRVKNQQI